MTDQQPLPRIDPCDMEAYRRFHDCVKQDTPRLVVTYKREGDKDVFQWGVLGAVPVLTLIGAIVRVQSEIYYRTDDLCPEPALVISWGDKTTLLRPVNWFVDEHIPVDPLVGMLEVIKAVVVGTHMARQAAAQQVRILGPDGIPVVR